MKKEKEEVKTTTTGAKTKAKTTQAKTTPAAKSAKKPANKTTSATKAKTEKKLADQTLAEKTKLAISKIIDENSYDNVILYDEDGLPIEFEQAAVVSLENSDKLYTILIPVTAMQNVEEGQGVVFSVDVKGNRIEIEKDNDVIDEVLEVLEENM